MQDLMNLCFRSTWKCRQANWLVVAVCHGSACWPEFCCQRCSRANLFMLMNWKVMLYTPPCYNVRLTDGSRR